MNCQIAEQMIMPYINGILEEEKKEPFFRHILDCPDCYDEFEIYYTTLVVLQKIEKEPDSSYDMKSLLEKTIEEEMSTIYRKRIFRVLKKTVFFLAEAGIVMVILLELGLWSKI